MYKRYDKYKDSGVEWIGGVPMHWDENKLKYMAYVKSSNVDKKIEEDEQEVSLCNYTDVYYNDVIDSNIEFMKATAKSEEIDKFELQTGDVIITKDSETWDDIAVPAYVTSKLDKVLCGYHLALVRSFNNKSLGKYIFRAFSSNGIRDQFMVSANGITRFGLSISSIKSALFPCPPLHEQKSIAKFLNHKTSEIDSLIADKEELIKKLEEYKQSIITEAVTKGLNPDVKMKDSGIEWIGEIPEHWSIVKMRYLLDKIKTGSTPTTQNQSYFDGDIDWFTPADFVDIKLASSKRKISLQALIDGEAILFEENTVLLVGIGATIGKVAMTNKKCSSNQQITGLTTKSNRMLPLYLTYWLHLNQKLIKAFSNNTTLPILNNEGIRSLYCILPPLKEQTAIANYLEQETLRIDELILDIEDHKDQLREYRQSLIYEAVTGKIDVCDYQPERSEQFA